MKRYLADTHAVLWFAAGDVSRLGRRARRVFAALAARSVDVAVSVVSLWEVALLHDEGAIRLPAGFSAWCEAVEAELGLRVEPLLLDDVEAARALADLRDPHDRLIAGTSVRLGAPLLTADARLSAAHGVETIW